MRWEVIGTSADVNPDDPEPAVMLSLKSNEETRKMWPFEFECTYEVTLRREKLKCEFCVKNCADDLKDELEFTAALHSYIEVVDATDSENVYAKGNLKGNSYMDKEIDAKNPPLMTSDNDRLTFGTKLVDSIFLNTDPEVLLHVGNGAAVSVENTKGWRDHVIWNPHENMPQVTTLRNLCAMIYRARSSQPPNLALEEELFLLLMAIYTSTEAMAAWSKTTITADVKQD